MTLHQLVFLSLTMTAVIMSYFLLYLSIIMRHDVSNPNNKMSEMIGIIP